MSAITEAIGQVKLEYSPDNSSWTEVTKLYEFNPPEISYKRVDMSYHGVGQVRRNKSGLGEPGTGKGMAAWQPALVATLNGLVGNASNDYYWRVTYGDGAATNSVKVFQGYLAKVGDKTPFDEHYAFEFEIQQSGALTSFTQGSN
jgi:hypothetical protein